MRQEILGRRITLNYLSIKTRMSVWPYPAKCERLFLQARARSAAGPVWEGQTVMHPSLSVAAVLNQLDCFLPERAAQFVLRYRPLFGRYYDMGELEDTLSGRGRGAAILRQAETLAGIREAGTEAPRALRGIFGQLSVGDSVPAPMYYPVCPLSATKAVFPQAAPEAVPDTAARHQEAFYRDMDQIAAGPPDTAEAFELLLDTVLQKYMWCIPARTAGGDVSLYDAGRLAAAIAWCLELGADQEEPFLLVSGDFSGIQRYIFAAAHTSARDVAKRLRARSFLIDTTVSALAHVTARRLFVPCQNLLMLCGGKFQMLVPNLPGQQERLSLLREETDGYLFRRYKGEISVNLAWISFGPEGFADYGAVVSRLAQALREQKNRPFYGQLTTEAGWAEDAFPLYRDLAGKTLCPSCRSRLIPSEEALCRDCAQQAETGRKLTRASTLWFSHERGELELLEDCYLSFSQENAGPLYQVVRLNSWEIPRELTRFPLTVRSMANNLPVGPDGEPLTFSDLAERSKGSDRLGVFKADVDNLGYLFADGFRTGDQAGSAGRVVALSRMLELFFSGYVNTLIKEQYPTVYSVFSGGDDLFLIGPWDTLVDLAAELEEDFHAFASHNPCVTISGALMIADPKTHVAALAETCEERLKQVKDTPPGLIYPNRPGRDGVYFMGQRFTWPDLRRQLKIGERLQALARKGNVSILRRILRYSQMYQSFLETGDVFQLMYDPLFYYDRKRNYGDLFHQNLWLEQYIDCLAKNAANLTIRKTDLYFAQTAVRYALSRTKEVRK